MHYEVKQYKNVLTGYIIGYQVFYTHIYLKQSHCLIKLVNNAQDGRRLFFPTFNSNVLAQSMNKIC
jgi:hypothetical protein